MKPYQSILLATDFSPLSELAAQRAQEVAERYHADLHVVHVIEEVVFYLKTELAAQEIIISDPLRNFIDVISYVLPNFSVFDFTLEAAHGLAVDWNRIFISIGYGSLYVIILLTLASFIFNRREFN